LHGVVTAVLGLDNRPQAQPRFRTRRSHGNVHWRPALAASASFTPIELAALYGFPSGTGQGECIGIIELGGGYRTADLQKYFAELKVASPKVSAVSVDHGRNNLTGDPNDPDGEVMLDIEVAGAVAPGASIVVLFCSQYRRRFPPGGARCHKQAVGDFNQLERSGIRVDSTVDDGVRRGFAGRRRNGGHGVRGVR
jgi:hypothetical protein